ncbi:CLUMA_CG003000, isoform A [Clunio marinus]|uniref:CLUMA_CG003000, isoform A n=1 Tax=Clunio marinus TaxID=568069 RepID=A0A1J1HSR6_9DIPT|nr:CLUMA_CG003000, isoform A [Clunio marinus]
METIWCSVLMFLLLIIRKNGLCQNFAESVNTRYDVESNEPQFITKGHLYRAVVGDTIVLPCKVKNLGSYILLWRRSAAVLTAANFMVTRDVRLTMVDGFNLQISSVKISDAGDYVCQIGGQEPKDQIHTLEILVPPTIRTIPDHGLVSAKQGSTVHLECKTSGNPVPMIHWFRKHSSMPLGEGALLTLEQVGRQHAGTYQCKAENGVRDAVYGEIILKVLSPPDITVEKAWVHAAEGCDVELICTLHSDANSDLIWYQNSFMLEPTDRRSIFTKGNKNFLRIQHFNKNDFGNYSCVADNSLGRTKKYIEVSGRPGPTVFLSTQYSNHLDRYNLTFKIESLSELDEIKLLYRKLMMNETYQKPGKWDELILYPSVLRYDSRHFVMSYIIRQLEHNSVYEVMVQAKNRYGWNEVSDIHQFHTRNYGYRFEDNDLGISSISLSSKAINIEPLTSRHFLLIFGILLHVIIKA